MTRILPLAALLAGLAACAPIAPPGTPLSAAELQSALPGRVSDFSNGVLITWKADGTFTYQDRYDQAEPDDRRGGMIKWGTGGTWRATDGQVCMTFPGLTRCDGMFRTASGGLVATILNWPYAFTLR